MPAKQQNKDVDQDDWIELRRTLQKMQINMYTSIQQSHEQHHEVMTMIHPQQHRNEPVIQDDEDFVDKNSFAPLQTHNNQPRNHDRGQAINDRHWENGFKSDLPEFTGSIRGEKLIDWIITVEEILEFKQVLVVRQVALVATKFCGKAASWWLNLKSTRAREGKTKIASWDKLKKYLRKTFLPYNFDRTMFTRLQNLRQGSSTLDEYADEFFLLMTRNKIHNSEFQIVSRCIGGLRPHLQNALEQFDHNTVAKAHRRAATFERQFRYSSSSWNFSLRLRNTTLQDQATSQCFIMPNPDATSNAPCIRPTNRASTSTKEQPLRQSSRPNALRCFACGEPGHLQTGCPKQLRRGLLIEKINPTYDSYHDDHEEIDATGETELKCSVKLLCK